MRGVIAGGLAAFILCSPAISGPILAEVDGAGTGEAIRAGYQLESGAALAALVGLDTGVVDEQEDFLRFADRAVFQRLVQRQAHADAAVAWSAFETDGFLTPPAEPSLALRLPPRR
jgi:hypothetical protein